MFLKRVYSGRLLLAGGCERNFYLKGGFYMKQLKILIVDDCEGIRDFLKYVLADDYRVMTACSGEEGLKLVEQNPDINLVISDRNMRGGMLGEELIRRVKSLNPGLNAILI